jgi:hypothetical protein
VTHFQLSFKTPRWWIYRVCLSHHKCLHSFIIRSLFKENFVISVLIIWKSCSTHPSPWTRDCLYIFNEIWGWLAVCLQENFTFPHIKTLIRLITTLSSLTLSAIVLSRVSGKREVNDEAEMSENPFYAWFLFSANFYEP